tara:strand:+ start:229 stop:669 length:441 start_codon:yes stop_codon:yes gene_type:complete
MSKVIRQQISIKSDPKSIFKELLSWGRSNWWPKILMQFRDLPEDIQEGTVYLQKVNLPFGPKWHTRNTLIKSTTYYIQRTFLGGIFDGFEELTVIPKEDVSEVAYCFHYIIRGTINELLWFLFFKRLHEKNINLILTSLKQYLEEK